MEVRRKWLVATVLGALVAALAWWGLSRSTSPAGPIMGVANRAGTAFTQTTYGVVVGDKVAFGGWPLENTTRSRFVITRISVTNVPPGLYVQAGPARRVIGASATWLPTDPVPFMIAAGTKRASVIVNVEPMKPGRFVIQGLLIQYVWQKKYFDAYVPDQFTVCAARSRSKAIEACAQLLPPPPKIWPMGNALTRWLAKW